ncbi:translation elongation factor EF1A/initiation factor IF2gamma [Dunaliella salina]|nr:translation elongation factor EF1A/initiation factor IF2gamma [Dunaliella salina]|eukprot:KAF5841984.1 translation elongation factor EF1A/initiation factor IF2gamma [Dunaliella salina]
MIGGAAAADAALLLVDGSHGGFEAGFEVTESSGGGQTREHAQLARSLGVEQVAVVVSKLDLVDNPQERFEHVHATLAPFLHSICGFRPANVQWLPAVGPSGQNLVAQPGPDSALASWWKGPTLAQAIDGFYPRERLTGKPLRLPVSDVFKNKAGALVVAGKVEAGALRAGSKVLVVPGQVSGSIRSMEVGGQPVQLVRAGDAAELALSGMDASGIPTGAVLCHPEFPVPLATKFELRVVVLEVAVPVLKGQSATVHAHVAREVGHISSLIALMSPKTGEVTKTKPRCLLRGQTAMVEVTCHRGLCIEEYSDLKPLGRVALRDGGRTLAVGVVTRLLG